MTRYTVRPLSDRTWLRPPGTRRTTPFSTAWPDTEALLGREVEQLRGRNLVIEVDVREQDIRLDGMLRASARAESPAVIVAFESSHGPMLYRCDRYVGHLGRGKAWQENVRAIAKTLEALRAVDRYGATETGEQYAGFKALPAGGSSSSHMTRAAAAELLERIAIGEEGARRERAIELIASSTDQARLAWREARKAAHPDHRDGDHAMWDQVEQAAQALGLTR